MSSNQSLAANTGMAANTDITSSANAIASGSQSEHTCTISSDLLVACWGDNAHMQLGTGDDKDVGCGTNCGAMGNDLALVRLGQGK